MKRKLSLALAVLLALLPLAACGEQAVTERPAPDLRGTWKQVGDPTNAYHIATIRDDTMEIYWFVVEDGSMELYWTGSFIPPENGNGSYSWTSVSNLQLETSHDLPWALRDETKKFTYNNDTGRISYTVNLGNIPMGVALEKVSFS